MTRRSLPNGVTTDWVYDAAGFLGSVTSKQNGSTFDSHVYTRDAVGNVVDENANGVHSTFVYDDLYRLSSARVRGVDYSWAYDAVGNRLSQTAGGATTTYTYNAANRLTSVNGVPVTHDANGNLVAYGNDTYEWDVQGHLLSLTRGGAQPLTASFSYDYRGRRTSMRIDGWGPYYAYDGDDVVTEIRGDPVHMLQGPNLDEPLVRHGPFFPAQFYTPDQLGSTTCLTDAFGNVGQSYQYSPFGVAAQSPTPGNPIQFAGRERDQSDPREIDIKETFLYFSRNRYYAPEWGRFISEDPIGFKGGINPYVYLDNSPINGVDPYGLEPVPGTKLPYGPDGIVYRPEKRGLAPRDAQGKKIDLHHRGQCPDGPIDEMQWEKHRGKGNNKDNHPTRRGSDVDHGPAWDKWRREYWEREWDSGRFDDLPEYQPYVEAPPMGRGRASGLSPARLPELVSPPVKRGIEWGAIGAAAARVIWEFVRNVRVPVP
jgi:RHS repeat-associated protein